MVKPMVVKKCSALSLHCCLNKENHSSSQVRTIFETKYQNYIKGCYNKHVELQNECAHVQILNFSGVIYAIVCSTQLPMLQNTSAKFIRGKTNLDASNAKSVLIT